MNDKIQIFYLLATLLYLVLTGRVEGVITALISPSTSTVTFNTGLVNPGSVSSGDPGETVFKLPGGPTIPTDSGNPPAAPPGKPPVNPRQGQTPI